MTVSFTCTVESRTCIVVSLPEGGVIVTFVSPAVGVIVTFVSLPTETFVTFASFPVFTSPPAGGVVFATSPPAGAVVFTSPPAGAVVFTAGAVPAGAVLAAVSFATGKATVSLEMTDPAGVCVAVSTSDRTESSAALVVSDTAGPWALRVGRAIRKQPIKQIITFFMGVVLKVYA
jgi:hypothetical protein